MSGFLSFIGDIGVTLLLAISPVNALGTHLELLVEGVVQVDQFIDAQKRKGSSKVARVQEYGGKKNWTDSHCFNISLALSTFWVSKCPGVGVANGGEEA
jgi:hypothetical protein